MVKVLILDQKAEFVTVLMRAMQTRMDVTFFSFNEETSLPDDIPYKMRACLERHKDPRIDIIMVDASLQSFKEIMTMLERTPNSQRLYVIWDSHLALADKNVLEQAFCQMRFFYKIQHHKAIEYLMQKFPGEVLN